MGSNLAEFESRIKHLENLKIIYDNPRFQFYKGMTSADLLSDFNRFNKLKKDLPALKKKHELEKAKNSTSLESIQATDAYYKADSSIQVLEPFYGQFKFAPVALNDIDDELEAIQKELAKIKPEDLSGLPSNDPQRILIQKLKRHFVQLGFENEMQARSTLEPVIKSKPIEKTKTTETDLEGKRTNRTTTTTEKSVEQKSYLDWGAAFRNGRRIIRPIFEKQLDIFLKQREMRKRIPAEDGGETKFDIKAAIKNATNRVDTIGPLSAKLPDIIKLYDYKFFQEYQKAVERLTEKRNLEIKKAIADNKNSPVNLSVPAKFDPVKNIKDFEAAAKEAAQFVRENTDEGKLIGILFDTIQSELTVEIKKAKDHYLAKTPSNPNPSVSEILSRISKTNPNFVKSAGFDELSFETLIEKSGQLTLEDFLELKVGKVSNLPNEYVNVAIFLLKGGAIAALPIAFINYQAQKAKKAVKDTGVAAGQAFKGVVQTKENLTGETARKQEEAENAKITPSDAELRARLDRLRKQRGR